MKILFQAKQIKTFKYKTDYIQNTMLDGISKVFFEITNLITNKNQINNNDDR